MLQSMTGYGSKSFKIDDFEINIELRTLNSRYFDSKISLPPTLYKHELEINNLLKFMRSLPNSIFARLTGSGSCIFSAFESKKQADDSLIIFKDRFPLLWSRVAENNFKHN